MKIALHILSIDNFWSRFFKAKYVKKCHLVNTKPTPTCYSFWKDILKVVSENTCVKIRE